LLSLPTADLTWRGQVRARQRRRHLAADQECSAEALVGSQDSGSGGERNRSRPGPFVRIRALTDRPVQRHSRSRLEAPCVRGTGASSFCENGGLSTYAAIPRVSAIVIRLCVLRAPNLRRMLSISDSTMPGNRPRAWATC